MRHKHIIFTPSMCSVYVCVCVCVFTFVGSLSLNTMHVCAFVCVCVHPSLSMVLSSSAYMCMGMHVFCAHVSL